MRQITIDLSDDVYSYLQLRAAIDDLRPKEAIEGFLTEIVGAKMEGRTITRRPQ